MRRTQKYLAIFLVVILAFTMNINLNAYGDEADAALISEATEDLQTETTVENPGLPLTDSNPQDNVSNSETSEQADENQNAQPTNDEQSGNEPSENESFEGETEVKPNEGETGENSTALDSNTLAMPPANPALVVNLTANSDKYKTGDIAVYTVTVKNIGDVELAKINVADALGVINGEIVVLAAGAEETLYGVFQIPIDFADMQLTNTVRASVIFAEAEVWAESNAVIAQVDIDNSHFNELRYPKEKYVDGDTAVSEFESVDETQKFIKNFSIMDIMEYAALAAVQDNVIIDKTAAKSTNCRTFDVTLSISGTPIIKPVDTLLVIDSSGSMDEGNPTSMDYAKQAAKNFTDQLLQDSNNRVAVIEFFYDGSGKGDLYDDTDVDSNFSNNAKNVKNAIDRIRPGGGTNTEAGFLRAKEVITDISRGARADAEKIIVFLTDGVPTISIGRNYGPSEPTVHNSHTSAAIAAAQQAQSVADVFTVGLLGNVPSQCLPIARDVLQQGQDAGYYETMQGADLTGIYNTILSKINYIAKNAVVTDVIGDNFELVEGSVIAVPDAPVTVSIDKRTITWIPGRITQTSTLTYKVKAKPDFAGGANVPTNNSATVSYTDGNGTQRNNIFPVPMVNVDPPFRIDALDKTIIIGDTVNLRDGLTAQYGLGTLDEYIYSWRSDSANWISVDKNPQLTPENTSTYTVTVTDKDGCIAQDTFTVTVIKGTLTIQVVVENEEASDTEFPVWVNGPYGVKFANLIKDNETITITGLKLGTYEIQEVIPMNYSLSSITTRIIDLSRNSLNQTVIIKYVRSNNSWFFDTGKEDNFFTVINEIAAVAKKGTVSKTVKIEMPVADDTRKFIGKL